MNKMKTKKRWLSILCGLAVTLPALAQTEPGTADLPAQTSSSSLLQTIKDKGIASYTMWVTGPTYGDVDGMAGPGQEIVLNQFAKIGYKISDTWAISATQYWTSTIREDSRGQRGSMFMDPYVTLSNSSIVKSTKYHTNLAAYARVYLPISHESADSGGSAKDQKNGKIRIKIEPSKEFADGAIAVNFTSFFIKNFASAPPMEGVSSQRDFSLWFYPSVHFNIHPKFQPYFAYSNFINHQMDKNRDGNGRWDSFNKGQNIELGFEWQPIKGLNINPYTEFGPEWNIGKSTIGLIAEYAFL